MKKPEYSRKVRLVRSGDHKAFHVPMPGNRTRTTLLRGQNVNHWTCRTVFVTLKRTFVVHYFLLFIYYLYVSKLCFSKKWLEHILISETLSEVWGILSATMSMKTVIVSSTDKPRVIFSPLSGGSRNLKLVCWNILIRVQCATVTKCPKSVQVEKWQHIGCVTLETFWNVYRPHWWTFGGAKAHLFLLRKIWYCNKI